MTTTPARPDHRSRTRDGLARIFEFWGEFECPQLDGQLYHHLCRDVARDDDLLEMASRAPANQPPPNLLFAGVHDLLLRGERHALAEWYPTLAAESGSLDRGVRDAASAFPVFRAFCLEHRARIEERVASRLTQTNVVQRCSGLLPAFARVLARGGERPLALIEIGPSAGLNLQWDRFAYRYHAADRQDEIDEIVWGDPGSPVHVECELRGDGRWPALPSQVPVAWRRGVDIQPIDLSDAEAVAWLRALVWPEHVAAMQRLTAAIEMARGGRPPIVRGDASLALPDLIAEAPADATVCVYGTHTLYQFPPDALRATLRAMQDAARARDVYFVTAEGTGDRCSELKVVEYPKGGSREDRATTLVARCSPHGGWIEWLPEA